MCLTDGRRTLRIDKVGGPEHSSLSSPNEFWCMGERAVDGMSWCQGRADRSRSARCPFTFVLSRCSHVPALTAAGDPGWARLGTCPRPLVHPEQFGSAL